MIGARFFTSNRQHLIDLLDSNLVVITAYTSVQRSNDEAQQFEQEANFWYLTGIDAPDWQLIIEGKKSWLIAPDIEEVHRIFDGSLSVTEAKKISGVDEVLEPAEGKQLLQMLSQKYKSVATLGKDPRITYYNFALNPAPVSLLRQLKKLFHSVEDCRLAIAKLRAIKQPVEIAALKDAIDLTIHAFNHVRSQLGSFKNEYEIEAAFSHYLRTNGAKGYGYHPVIASGKNACTLHHNDNNDPIDPAGLLLLDVGAQSSRYTADITRTYAIGTPSKRQIDVHKAVETAHKEIIELLKPGLSVLEYQDKVDEIMKRELAELGLFNDPADYRKYFPHAISHGLGIDAHDSLGRPETFQPGMVLTVEPGLYIAEEGIGVRIEDDILITKTGHQNLSAALPTSL